MMHNLKIVRGFVRNNYTGRLLSLPRLNALSSIGSLSRVLELQRTASLSSLSSPPTSSVSGTNLMASSTAAKCTTTFSVTPLSRVLVREFSRGRAAQKERETKEAEAARKAPAVIPPPPPIQEYQPPPPPQPEMSLGKKLLFDFAFMFGAMFAILIVLRLFGLADEEGAEIDSSFRDRIECTDAEMRQILSSLRAARAASADGVQFDASLKEVLQDLVSVRRAVAEDAPDRFDRASTAKYTHQVGGHGSDQRSGPDSQGESSSGADKKGDLHPSKEGFLRHPRDSHVILKPVAKGQKGQVEKDFYRDLEHDDSGIQQFVPRFLGFVVLKSSKDGEPHEYIAMEDATHRFRRPCIADIKIGVRTFDPHASGSKIVKEILKYPQQASLGYRIVGMKVWDPHARVYRFYNKLFGRSLDSQDQLVDAFDVFFGERNVPLAPDPALRKAPLRMTRHAPMRTLANLEPLSLEGEAAAAAEEVQNAIASSLPLSSSLPTSASASLNRPTQSKIPSPSWSVEVSSSGSSLAPEAVSSSAPSPSSPTLSSPTLPSPPTLPPPSLAHVYPLTDPHSLPAPPAPPVPEGVSASLLNQLRGLRDWYAKEGKHCLYSSSLLLVYEGDPDECKRMFLRQQQQQQRQQQQQADQAIQQQQQLLSPSLSSLSSSSSPPSFSASGSSLLSPAVSSPSTVLMIDFAHAYKNATPDDVASYVFGLNSLISTLEARETEPKVRRMRRLLREFVDTTLSADRVQDHHEAAAAKH